MRWGVMIVVLVPPAALSAAHGTETVIMSSSGFGNHRDVPVRLPMVAIAGWTGTVSHMIGHQGIKIAKSVR